MPGNSTQPVQNASPQAVWEGEVEDDCVDRLALQDGEGLRAVGDSGDLESGRRQADSEHARYAVVILYYENPRLAFVGPAFHLDLRKAPGGVTSRPVYRPCQRSCPPSAGRGAPTIPLTLQASERVVPEGEAASPLADRRAITAVVRPASGPQPALPG